MPSGVRGALVQQASAPSDGLIDVTWIPAGTPRLPFGQVSLQWEPASLSGWDISAHLGLATVEVRLASWLAAPDDWPRLVHPTIHEVRGLCAALAVATAALDLSNQLAEV
ncbi:esterase [Streptomyces sp. NPDC059913]|uniref:esterase n=1 Tax=unclassified Streptomyces TaxID=2593676 RepID=UPI003650A9C3